MRALCRFVPLLLLLASTGCGVFADPAPTATPTATPTITPTPTPTATPTPPPRLEARTIEVAQGRVARLEVSSSADSAVATFEAQEYALLPKSGGFWGLIGVGAQHPAGSLPVTIVLRDASGRPLDELTATLAVVATGYPVEEIIVPPDQSALLDPNVSAQEEAMRSAVFARSAPERLWEGSFILPVDAPVSSPYGIGRSYNGGPITSYHKGTDFPVDEGTPVVAANAGRVAFAGTLPIRGLSVIVDHGAGVMSGYHHLQSAAVAEGETVAAGDLIGYSGASGLATGPHLHWEIVVRGVEVDPVFWTYEEIGP